MHYSNRLFCSPVLSGRLDDPEILNRSNLQVVNLVMTTSPREKMDKGPAINAFIAGLVNNPIVTNLPNFSRTNITSPKYSDENRMLTPRKYRCSTGRDFGTQTDNEKEELILRNKIQSLSMKDSSPKERKDAANCREADKY